MSVPHGPRAGYQSPLEVRAWPVRGVVCGTPKLTPGGITQPHRSSAARPGIRHSHRAPRNPSDTSTSTIRTRGWPRSRCFDQFPVGVRLTLGTQLPTLNSSFAAGRSGPCGPACALLNPSEATLGANGGITSVTFNEEADQDHSGGVGGRSGAGGACEDPRPGGTIPAGPDPTTAAIIFFFSFISGTSIFPESISISEANLSNVPCIVCCRFTN